MNILSLFLPFLLTLAIPRCAADEEVYHNDQAFDAAEYGVYPVQKYRSTNLVSARLNVLQSSSECDSSLYTLLTPRGPLTSEPTATILDHDGHLIWTAGWQGQQIYNLMVQEYKGENYLTFWAGNDAVGGHGAGFYYMLDEEYKLFKQLGAAGGLDADLHDFRITKDGTALMTVYQVINKDLTDLGKPIFGEIWDCLIQEVNIETGELVFQWRASDHYKVADTIKPIAEDGVIGRAFDFFHLNSIDKDSKGNYLISARFTRSLTYINGSDGEMIWIMGGTRNMFKDLSNGKATDFAYQHDARWSDDHTITMFDNGVDDGHPDLADTRGLRLKLDEDKMTVEVVAEYKNPHGIHGISQGSFQTLPNGNGFLGYGNTAAFTEYSHDGKVLCDVHFGAESRFGAGEVQSYRVYKYSWHGFPTTDPEVAILQNDDGKWSFYVSWNGATEVKEWVLQGSDSEENNDGWVDLERVLKEGFETEFDIHSAYPRYMRVLGLDSSFNILGVGGSLDLTTEKVVFNTPATELGNEINSTQTWSLPPLRIEEGDTWWLKIMLVFCALGGMFVGLREAQTVWRTRRQLKKDLSFPMHR